ncbi:hypothetical protein D3C80_1692600 [compost metagenome]
MADVGQNNLRAANHLIECDNRVEIAMITRRFFARRMAAIDHDDLRLVVEQEFHRLFRQPGGVRQPRHAAVRAFQQIAKRQLRVVQRQRRHSQTLEFEHHKGFNRPAKIQNAGMFEQVVAARVVRRTVNGNGRAHAPA